MRPKASKPAMCPDCGQPMLPKCVKKQPNEYDHASGCPQERFYIQNRGYCGNCLQWWRADRHGYTMDLREALKVGRKEAESNRDTMSSTTNWT